MSSPKTGPFSGPNPTIVALRACRTHLVYAAVFSAAINLLYLAPTLYMLQVYDRVVTTHGVTTLLFLTALLLVSLAALSLLDLVRSRLLVRASARLERTLAPTVLLANLARQPLTPTGQAMKDFDVVRQAVTGSAVLALFDAPWTVIYIGLCFVLHPVIGLLAIAGCGSLAGLTLLTERSTRPRLEQASRAATWSYASMAQSAAARDVVHALGMRGAVVARHQVERATVTRLQGEASFSAGRFLALTKFARLALQSLGLGVAAYLALGQEISAGAIFAASLLMTRALAPMETLLSSWKSLGEAHGAYNNLTRSLEATTSTLARTQLPPPAGRLLVDEITVTAGAERRPVLSNVSLALAPGEVLGLVGPSGSGKTTLLRALVGAADLQRGQIRLDGANIADWDSDRLGRFIGYLPQDVSLMQGTVKQNICRFRDQLGGDPGALDEKVIAAAQESGAHDMILGLPDGYDTLLDWGGRGVSLGQAQRIGLARALYDTPQLIVLDEPNAHLDAEGEMLLLRSIDGLKARGAAVVVVAHRASMLGAMDRLIVLERGHVAQQGRRDDVLRLVGSAGPGRPELGAQREVA